MAQKRQKQNKKLVYLILLLVIFIAAGVAVFFALNGKGGGTNDQEVEKVVEEKKNEQIEPTVQTTSEETGKKKVEQYEGEDPNLMNELSGVVTYAGVNGDKLMIRVNIDQYLQGGECELTLSRAGSTIYNGRADIIDNVSTSTCEGFDVSLAGLGSGKADITVSLNAEGKTGIIKGEVEL